MYTVLFVLDNIQIQSNRIKLYTVPFFHDNIQIKDFVEYSTIFSGKYSN